MTAHRRFVNTIVVSVIIATLLIMAIGFLKGTYNKPYEQHQESPIELPKSN